MSQTGARVLVIGLDGATWDLADRFMAEGRMPVMEGLVAGGARAPLNSTMPPMTLPSWSSMLTGCNPGRHGIFDFVRRQPGTWDLEFTNATHRLVPTVHRVLSDRGARVASIAVPTTWPPDDLNGVVVSGFDSPVSTGIDGSFCHPPGLYSELQRRFGGLRFADFQETDIGPGWHEAALAALMREIPRKESIGRWLMGRERFDLFMMLFGESDTASHHFWMFMDEASPRHPARWFGRRIPPALRDAIATVYSRLDQAVGRLIDQAQPDVVCLCSDHGFGGAGEHVLFLNRYLEQHGWLRYRRAVTVEGVRTGSGMLDRAKAVALKRLPAAAQGRLFRLLPDRLVGQVESRSRYGDLDRAATRAVSDEMNYAATLSLEVPEGDRAAAIAELTPLLLDWTVEGQKVVERVHLREDLYDGEALPLAPDLVLELAYRDGYSYTLLPSARAAAGQTWRRLETHEHPGGKGLGMNGTHRQHGVLLLSGAGVQPGARVRANMPDIAPTLLHLMGEGVPAHMDGRVLTEALSPDLGPVRVAPAAAASAGPTSASSDEAAAIRERLERLGYL